LSMQQMLSKAKVHIASWLFSRDEASRKIGFIWLDLSFEGFCAIAHSGNLMSTLKIERNSYKVKHFPTPTPTTKMHIGRYSWTPPMPWWMCLGRIGINAKKPNTMEKHS